MVAQNLQACRQKIAAAARRSGRAPEAVELVAITKGVPVELIREAIDQGVLHLGENKVQETLARYDVLNVYAAAAGHKLLWHMVGHLQSNKAKDAVRLFDVIHSVDTIRLAEEIDKAASRRGKVQDILLEVNVSGEASKYGFAPRDVKNAVQNLTALPRIRILGLMTVAPIVADPEKARPYFRALKELALDLFVHGPILSMGMTDDFEVAVEEGATHVRIGRGIFGSRGK